MIIEPARKLSEAERAELLAKIDKAIARRVRAYLRSGLVSRETARLRAMRLLLEQGSALAPEHRAFLDPILAEEL